MQILPSLQQESILLLLDVIRLLEIKFQALILVLLLDSHISGSAIVDGTLSASKLAANTVLGNSLIAQNSIQLSPGGTGGKLFGEIKNLVLMIQMQDST